MKKLMCKPCWFWLRLILHFYGNFLFLSQLITLSPGEVRLYFLEIDLKGQIKTSWNFAVSPTLHLFYQKSPSSKSRIRFTYFLLTATQPQLRTVFKLIKKMIFVWTPKLKILENISKEGNVYETLENKLQNHLENGT